MAVGGKDKIKSRPEGSDKLLASLDLDNSPDEIISAPIIIANPFRRKDYWPLLILLVQIAFILFQLSQSWLVKTTFSQTETYPKATVLGTDFGGLDSEQLNIELAKLKTGFEAQKFTFENGNDKWDFDFGKLGVSIDTQATSQAIWQLNSLSLTEKYRLLTGGISSIVEPKVIVAESDCTESLSTISIPPTEPKNAVYFYDEGLKITPDESGTNYSAILTCHELASQLAADKIVASVSSDITLAGLIKADLESKQSEVLAKISEQLLLESGAYKLTLTPSQLLDLLEISKIESGVQVNWSTAKLDELVNNISAEVNTYNASPALGACQQVTSTGGNWLDKDATKKIFTDLGPGSARSYTLKFAYYAPVVKSITPINSGTSGTIYLTYDDGLTYGDRIMNYASCYGIKVTFFELGVRVATDATALKRAIAEGHAVQSHGYEHKATDYGTGHSYEWQYNDMSASISAIMSVTGVRPTYFRPPGGNRSPNGDTNRAASDNGLTLIMWGDASRDSAPSGVTSALTCSNVLAGAYPGASVLMHSTKLSTAEAMPCIVEGLAARGYSMQALR